MFTEVLLSFLKIQFTNYSKENYMECSVKNYGGTKRRKAKLVGIEKEVYRAVYTGSGCL